MKLFKTLYILPLFLFLFSCTQQIEDVKPKTPKYIFLCIGDGMGQAQIQSADLFLRETTGDSLDIMYLPVNGDQFTYSASSNITCSSASGTAYSCGHKANNGQVCLTPEEGDTLYSVAKAAKEAGMKVGILTTVSIDHATPAVFYAHNESRHNYHEISLELAKSNYDFFGGGGFKDPIKDSVNAYTKAQEAGYKFITNKDSLEMASTLNKKIVAYNPNTILPFAIDNEEGFTLADLTRNAIKTIDNPDGFFMMIEGGKIDWACHANDITTSIHETINFNEAVLEILKFYKEHKDETLVIVTADHETGGLGIGSENFPYKTNFPLLKNQTISYDNFGKVLFNEVNDKFTFDNYLEQLAKYYNFNVENGVELTKDDIQRLKNAYDFVMNDKAVCNAETHRVYNIKSAEQRSDKIQALVVTANAIIGEKAGLGWTTFAHTGVQVPIRAIGVGSDRFESQIDNTEIAHIIFEFIGK